MQNKMNMKNNIHKCVPRNSQINLSVQEFEWTDCCFQGLAAFDFTKFLKTWLQSK